MFVRRDPEVRQHALRGIGPAVAGEQRRREHERGGPHDRRVPHQGERVLAVVALGPRDVPAEPQPRCGVQAETDEHDGEAGHPAGLRTAEVLEERDLHQGGRLGQRRDDDAADEHQQPAGKPPSQHVGKVGRLADSSAKRG